jgi:predicted amidohydrolase
MLNVGVAQIKVEVGRPEENAARARRFAGRAREAGADVLILPELWFHGYDLAHAEERAAPLGEGGFARMRALAREFELYVTGSTLERHAGGVSNTAALYDPQGALLGTYRKVHLFRLMDEDRYLAPGEHATLCETPWGPVGLAICYDLRFPELFRTLALAGAELILVPAQWPSARVAAWRTLVLSRAIENELFVAAGNRVGADGETPFPGCSLIVDPWGNVLAEGDEAEQLLVAPIDRREVAKVRRYLTVYQDRAPAAYHVAETSADG